MVYYIYVNPNTFIRRKEKTMKKVLSFVLIISILMSALSVCFVSYAEGQFSITKDEYTDAVDSANAGEQVAVSFNYDAIDSEKYYFYGYTVETATKTLYFESEETFPMPAENVSLKAVIKEKTVAKIVLSNAQPVAIDYYMGMALCESEWAEYRENANVTLDFNGDAKADAELIEDYNDGNPTYTIKLLADKSAPFGEYTLDVSHFGALMPYSAIKVTVKDDNKPATIVTASTTYKSTYGNALAFSVKITNANGKALAGKKVVFVFNGKTYTKTTDSKGYVKFTIPATNIPKTYAGKLSCEGITKTIKIVIQKSATKIKAPAKAFKKNQNIKKYQVTLKNNKSKGIKGVKITLKINKKTYSAKTNAKGVATFKIKIAKKGTFKAIVKFAGNKYYKASSKTVKIKVK